MATLAASAAAGALKLSFAAGPGAGLLGLGLVGLGAWMDSRVARSLADKDKLGPRPELLSFPQTLVGEGSPRVWAIGRAVRVPVHVMWQTQKTRRVGATSAKAGMAQSAAYNRVTASCALHLNDRPTARLLQLIGNGTRILWSERNLFAIETPNMTVAESGGRLTITMASPAEESFSTVFEAGDIVKLARWVPAGGTPNINDSYFRVLAVTSHKPSSPSRIVLQPYQGQTVVGVNSTAGTGLSPAEVRRIEDAIVEHAWTPVLQPGSDPQAPNYGIVEYVHLGAIATHPPPNTIFHPGEFVRLTGFGGTAGPLWNNASKIRVVASGTNYVRLDVRNARNATTNAAIQVPHAGATLTAGTSTNASRIEDWEPRQFSAGMLPATYVPGDHFHYGTETQGPDSIIVTEEGEGNVPSYRGQSYIVLEDLDLTPFGNQLPTVLEAIICAP